MVASFDAGRVLWVGVEIAWLTLRVRLRRFLPPGKYELLGVQGGILAGLQGFVKSEAKLELIDASRSSNLKLRVRRLALKLLASSLACTNVALFRSARLRSLALLGSSRSLLLAANDLLELVVVNDVFNELGKRLLVKSLLRDRRAWLDVVSACKVLETTSQRLAELIQRHEPLMFRRSHSRFVLGLLRRRGGTPLR